MGHERRLPKPDLTIVGGQPREEPLDLESDEAEVPVGFEMLLYRAARDSKFKAQLLADRKTAAAEWGIRLRPTERATLDAISDEMLGRMIDRIEPSNPQRNKFMVNVAAAVTSLAAGTVAVGTAGGCGDDSDTGGVSVTTTTSTTGIGGVSAGIPPGGTGGTGAQPWGGGGAGGGEEGGGGSGGNAGAGGAAGGAAGAGG